MRIEYRVPKEVRGAIEPHLKKWARFAPPWCYLLYVVMGKEQEGTPLEIWPQPEYRFANLAISPGFLRESDTCRAQLVLHELLHIHTAALRGVALKLVDASAYADDEKLRAGAMDEIRMADEGAVSDLMAVIHATAHRWM